MFFSFHYSIVLSFILALLLPGTTSKTRPVAPDHSLASAAYIQIGIPSHDRLWSGEDYQQAATILRALSDTTQLPRYKSPTSGALFSRFIAAENRKSFDTKPMSLEVELVRVSLLLQGISEVFGVYVTATTSKHVFDTEQVELLRYMLETSRDLVEMQAAFVAALPKDDPIRESRLEGQEMMRKGLATMISECLDMVTERETYRASEVIRLAQTLETTLPTMYSFLPPAGQQELPLRLKRMIEKEADAALKEQLTRLAAVVVKAQKS